MSLGTFAPPSPGAWELDMTHTQRPMSRFMATVFGPAMKRGFSEGTKHYGLLLDHIEMVSVNGFLYGCARPVGAPKSAKGAPPKPVFKLLAMLHPELRRRIKRSGEVMRTKAWREDMADWDARVKPAIAARNRELQRIDPTALSNEALAVHLR